MIKNLSGDEKGATYRVVLPRLRHGKTARSRRLAAMLSRGKAHLYCLVERE